MTGFASKEFMDGFKFARSEALKQSDEENESQALARKIGFQRREALEKQWEAESIARQEARIWDAYEREEQDGISN